MRLAGEYRAAQEAGEVAARGRPAEKCEDAAHLPTRDEVGIDHRVVSEGNRLAEAEAADPGVIRRTLDERLERGEEPTNAALAREAKTLAQADVGL
jgi:hypothetical protein